MYTDAKVSPKHDRNTIVPIIQFQSGYTSLASRCSVGPVLQIHTSATNGVGKVLCNCRLRMAIVSDLPVFQKHRTLAEMFNHRHIMTDENNRAPFCGGDT